MTCTNLFQTPEDTFGIVAKFKTDTGWSKEYTYAYDRELPVDTLIVVASPDNFLSILRVKRSEPNAKFIPGVKYKRVLEVLKTPVHDLLPKKAPPVVKAPTPRPYPDMFYNQGTDAIIPKTVKKEPIVTPDLPDEDIPY